jgi:hypothetical protein
MRNFVRKDVKILLGDNGLSWMMARGYGDIGELKGAMFVPDWQRSSTWKGRASLLKID